MIDRNFFLKLTDQLYKLTLLFPKKEPLRYKMRDLGDDILANYFRILKSNSSNSETPYKSFLLNDLEILDCYFEIAKSQNWVKKEKILSLKEKYQKIKEEINENFNTRLPIFNSENRQRKILEFLKTHQKVQVWEIKKIFPQISKRTLRRDFVKLLRQGKIKRLGEKSGTFYQLA